MKWAASLHWFFDNKVQFGQILDFVLTLVAELLFKVFIWNQNCRESNIYFCITKSWPHIPVFVGSNPSAPIARFRVFVPKLLLIYYIIINLTFIFCNLHIRGFPQFVCICELLLSMRHKARLMGFFSGITART